MAEEAWKGMSSDELSSELGDIASIGEQAGAQEAKESVLADMSPAQKEILRNRPDLVRKLSLAKKKRGYSRMLAGMGQFARDMGAAAAAAGGGRIDSGQGIYMSQMQAADRGVQDVYQEQGEARKEESHDLQVTQARQKLALADPTSKVNRNFQKQLSEQFGKIPGMKGLLPWATVETFEPGNLMKSILSWENQRKEQEQMLKRDVMKYEYQTQAKEQEWQNKLALQSQKDKAAMSRKQVGANAALGAAGRLGKQGSRILGEKESEDLLEQGQSVGHLFDLVNPEKVIATGENTPGVGGIIKNLVPNDWRGAAEYITGKAGQITGADPRSDEQLLRDTGRAQQIGSEIQNLYVPVRKAIAGTAVSAKEAKDLKAFFSLGPGNSSEDFSRRLLRFREIISGKWNLIKKRNPAAAEALAESMGWNPGAVGNKKKQEQKLAPPPTKKVVVEKDGKRYYLPAHQLKKALKKGYTQVN